METSGTTLYSFLLDIVSSGVCSYSSQNEIYPNVVMIIHRTISNDLYSEAATRLLSLLDEYFSSDASILLLLSGGSAVRLYPYLVDWIKAHPTGSFQGKLAVGQVDERLRPGREESGIRDQGSAGTEKRDKNINAVVIGEIGLWEVCREKGIACHLISQSESNSARAGTLEESASLYNQTISNIFKSASKTIAVLGIGEDGHTAGLLPGYRKDWDVDRMVVGYENDGPFPQRISLTPKALRQLDMAIVVAAGEKKRAALDQARSQKRTDLNVFPAAILGEMKQVEGFTDQK